MKKVARTRGEALLRNVSRFSLGYVALHPRRRKSPQPPLCILQIANKAYWLWRWARLLVSFRNVNYCHFNSCISVTPRVCIRHHQFKYGFIGRSVFMVSIPLFTLPGTAGLVCVSGFNYNRLSVSRTNRLLITNSIDSSHTQRSHMVNTINSANRFEF
jgi:hypothetical protein